MASPVCVTVPGYEVVEECGPGAGECYQQNCANTTTTAPTEQCEQVQQEMCEVIIETSEEQQCTRVEVEQFREECTTVEEQECR